MICGTDFSKYCILKTLVAGLRQALLDVCSPYLLDHPVVWPRWPILRQASDALKSTFTHNLGWLWWPVPDVAITVYPICPSRNITGLTSSWKVTMFFLLKGPRITCKQQVRFIGSLRCEFRVPPRTTLTISTWFHKQFSLQVSLTQKGEDQAQMSRHENVCLFSVPAFTISVLFPA